MTDTQYQSHHNGRYIHTVPDAGLVISRERRKEGRKEKDNSTVSTYLLSTLLYSAQKMKNRTQMGKSQRRTWNCIHIQNFDCTTRCRKFDGGLKRQWDGMG